MNTLTTSVPVWVSLLFLVTIPIPIYMIANLAKEGALQAKFEEKRVTKVFGSIIVFYLVYMIYVSIMSFTGIFQIETLPPMILRFTTLPLLLFFFLVVSRFETYKTILTHIKLESLVRVHIFRILGGWFFVLSAYSLIPTKFALIAGFGDIISAIASIFVANAIASKKSYATPLTIAWNIFGILDIVSVLTTAIITTKLAIETGSQGVTEIAKFPFSIIPAFAGASIIFLHVSVFRKLWMERNKTAQTSH